MKKSTRLSLVAAGALLAAPAAFAQSGDWAKRTAVTPDPTKVVVPAGYKVGVFAAGLDTPSSATVDKDGNLWVAISGKLLGSPEPIDRAAARQDLRQGRQADQGDRQGHVHDGDERDRLLRRERQDLHPGIRREDLGDRTASTASSKLIVKDLPIGDHRNGGITCKDGYLYFALGLPSNTGFADPDNHGWTDIPNDPFWVKHTATASARRRTIRSAATSCTPA